MEKIIKTIVVSFGVLSIFAFPASAQVTQSDQCTIVKNITIRTVAGSVTFDKGAVIKDGATSIDALNEARLKGSISTIREWGIVCLLNTINKVVNWVSLIVLILSTALIVYAGFLWMTSGQKPESQKKAGGVILAALIGFAIVILARIFPSVISGILL